MNFGALSRGFGTCCLRFKNRVATIPAKLASGWLARLYREGVEPSGSLQKVSDHNSRPPFLDLSWRKGSFMASLSERRDASFRLDVGRPDHPGPHLDLGRDAGRELLRRARDQVVAERDNLSSNISSGCCGIHPMQRHGHKGHGGYSRIRRP
jgi:hypothetical protein